MNKKLIRLTEADLHRIVKESVNKVLNEVVYNGQSYHGNNADDWGKVADIRRKNYRKSDNELSSIPYGDNSERSANLYKDTRKQTRHWRNDINNKRELKGQDPLSPLENGINY